MWYQIDAKTDLFYPVVQHTNVQSQIFMNINQNKFEVIEKLQKKIKGFNLQNYSYLSCLLR